MLRHGPHSLRNSEEFGERHATARERGEGHPHESGDRHARDQGIFDSLPDSDAALPPDDNLGALQRRNEELAEALRRARRNDKARMDFLAMVSHELRSPLNAITGFSDAALHDIHGPLPEAYRSYFSAIHGVGRHLELLVSNLLDLAQLEAGRFAVEPRPTSARLMVSEARSMVASLATRHGIDISAVALTRDWLLQVDPTRMRQILVNLLANAVKFTPRGGAVGTDALPCGPDHLELTVWDTGIGIARDQQERVFEAFHQLAGASTSNGGKGVGLGLAIARQLARAMNGDLLLTSEPGKGSRFIARLPVAPQMASAAE